LRTLLLIYKLKLSYCKSSRNCINEAY